MKMSNSPCLHKGSSVKTLTDSLRSLSPYKQHGTMEGGPHSRINLHPQAREIVHRVVKYFSKEKTNRGPIADIRKTLQRASEATMIPERTISRICKEGKDTEERCGTAIFLQREKHQPRTVTDVKIDKSVLRRNVLDSCKKRSTNAWYNQRRVKTQ